MTNQRVVFDDREEVEERVIAEIRPILGQLVRSGVNGGGTLDAVVAGPETFILRATTLEGRSGALECFFLTLEVELGSPAVLVEVRLDGSIDVVD